MEDQEEIMMDMFMDKLAQKLTAQKQQKAAVQRLPMFLLHTRIQLPEVMFLIMGGITNPWILTLKLRSATMNLPRELHGTYTSLRNYYQKKKSRN